MSPSPAATWREHGPLTHATRSIDSLARRARRHDVASGDGVLVVLPHAGHWVQYEASEDFNALLPGLLAR